MGVIWNQNIYVLYRIHMWMMNSILYVYVKLKIMDEFLSDIDGKF